jgi:negative regulator of sigma E activity
MRVISGNGEQERLRMEVDRLTQELQATENLEYEISRVKEEKEGLEEELESLQMRERVRLRSRAQQPALRLQDSDGLQHEFIAKDGTVLIVIENVPNSQVMVTIREAFELRGHGTPLIPK